MKLNTQITLLSLVLTPITITSAFADGSGVTDVDVELHYEDVTVPRDPLSPFARSNDAGTKGSTDNLVARLHQEGVNAKNKFTDLIDQTHQSREKVETKIAATTDPIARAVLLTQRGSLDSAATTLMAQLKRADALTHAYNVLGKSGVWWVMNMDGHQISAADGALNSQIVAFNQINNQTEEKVTRVINGTSDESTEEQVRAAKATLAKGTVATGGVLTAPGAVAGDEKIIVTEGVTNRTIPGQHGDLLMHGIGSGEAILRETTALGETKRNASLLMLGEHQEAKISAGESAILIGDNSKTEGNGIAIGKNATSGNDSIALGNNSVTTGANELSIGNENGLTRKIIHMADGTNDSDGATIHNLKSEISRLDTIALDYADTKKEQAITVANQYTDAAKTAAIDVANQYTDNKITTLDTQAQGYATAAKSEAVKDVNQYSDDTAQKTLKSANDYTERRAVVAENNAVTRSNAYTDESSSRTLESANTYTNHRSVQAENNA
ncbi:hypothetical protein FJ875_26975, partial [Salmonella enterica]|nr:hypothetical protein [Salmonella enterica]